MGEKRKKAGKIDITKVPRGHMPIPKGKAFKHKNDKRKRRKPTDQE